MESTDQAVFDSDVAQAENGAYAKSDASVAVFAVG